MAVSSSLINTKDPRFDHLREQARERIKGAPIPGVSLGVWHVGNEFTEAFGITSIENPLPVTSETLFQIGSISKTITATAIMRLVEMGKLDLDAPISRLILNLRLADEDVAARVTLRNVLTHTGGWVGDYFNDYGPDRDSLKRVVEDDLPKLAQLTPLGEVWSYSNSGFYIAGRAIEVATGKSYEEAIAELVFQPLGMTSAYFFPHDIITYRVASGHIIENDQPKVGRPWGIGRAGHAVGGVVASVHDLFKYARFHMGDGTAPDDTRLLSRESLTEMQKPHIAASGLDWMGLTWFITPLPDGRKIIRHGGATKGQMANLTFVPGEDFVYVILANSDDAESLIYDMRRKALKEFLGITLPEAEPIQTASEKLTQYVGRYDSAMASVNINVKDSTLELQVTWKGGFPTPENPPPSDQPKPTCMALYAEDRAIITAEPFKGYRCEFLRDTAGNVAWFRFESRVHKKLDGQ
jgi:CubicO group peptidase (beta-lactamase class C family)